MSFRYNGAESFGAVRDSGIVDIGRRYPKEFPTLRDFIAAGAHLRPDDFSHGSDLALGDIEYLLPVTNPGKILCVGINYAHRNEEYKDSRTPSERPNLFLRTTHSFVPHNAAIQRPRVSHQLDYEGEIALVIGKSGRYIEEADALDYIAGVTISNEGTLRDWLRHSRSNNTQGKNFDASGSIGPWIDTDAMKLDSMTLKTWVNDELRQNDGTSNLIYSFPYLLSYISQFTALHPGDIILTGTPLGAGVRFDPPKFLVPGDVLRIEVSGVGELRNPIIEENINPRK